MNQPKIDRSPRGVAARNGLSWAMIYRELKAGRLKAKKLGRRTIIPEHEERAWLDSLPDLTVDEHGRIEGNHDKNLKKAG